MIKVMRLNVTQGRVRGAVPLLMLRAIFDHCEVRVREINTQMLYEYYTSVLINFT